MSKTENPREGSRGQVPLSQGEILEIPGDLLSPETSSFSDISKEKALVIVVSHDCDIDANAKTEPFIEVIPITRIKKADPKKTHTKNPRNLHTKVAAVSEEPEVAIDIDARKKVSILKSRLWDLEFSRPFILDAKGVKELQEWLSCRYWRAALPGIFNVRFKKAEDAFWKLVAAYNCELLSVLFFFDEGQEKKECAEDESYRLSVVLIHSEGHLATDFDTLIEDIRTLFKSTYIDPFDETVRGIEIDNVPEIEILECRAISESAITLQAYRDGIAIRSAWISYEVDPPAPTVGKG
jgi:hypothetical protein